jgi:hypothetical protein
MVSFDTVVALRAAVAATLAGNLGTYGYNDAAGNPNTIPALWVVKGMDVDPPLDWTRNGLECLIFLPRGDGVPLLSEQALLIKSWRLRLIQHNREDSTLAGYRSLLKQWPQIRKESEFAHSMEFDAQMNLSIQTHEVI